MYKVTVAGDCHKDAGLFIVGVYPTIEAAVEAAEQFVNAHDWAYLAGAWVETHRPSETATIKESRDMWRKNGAPHIVASLF